MDRKAGERVAGGKVQSKRARNWQKMALLLRHYWHRLAGAALGWFSWDFYYCAPLAACPECCTAHGFSHTSAVRCTERPTLSLMCVTKLLFLSSTHAGLLFLVSHSCLCTTSSVA